MIKLKQAADGVLALASGLLFFLVVVMNCYINIVVPLMSQFNVVRRYYIIR